jgi:hypothetical protein
VRRSLIALLSAAALTTVAAPTAGAASLTGAQEIAFLNAQRAAAGIPPVTENLDWSAGCKLHMAYLKTNNIFQHDEDQALYPTGYTAEGDAAGNSSVLTSGGSSFSTTGANAFEQAPIHLMQMLNPFMVTSGAADGCLATQRDISRTFAVPTTFSYPSDGSTTVPVSQVAYEGPFVPGDFVGLSVHQGQGAVTGPHLYFYNAGPDFWHSMGAITSATLTGPSGPLEVRWVDDTTTGAPGNIGQLLSPGGIVIPVAPLAKNAAYTATVNFQPSAVGAAPVSRTWSFSTGVVAPMPAPVAATAPASTPAVPASPVASTADLKAAATLTKLTLKARSLSVHSTVDASLWVTIEQSRRKAGKTSWIPRRSLALPAKAGGVSRVTFPRLTSGTYRVKIRNTGATGPVVLKRTLTLR